MDLAVRTLTTRSNFVALSIGTFDGLSPLRILSTKYGARRQSSGKLTPHDALREARAGPQFPELARKHVFVKQFVAGRNQNRVVGC